MQDDVPFSRVLRLLETHGYRLLRRRKFPGEDAAVAVFGREGSPHIAIEVRDRRVAHEYFQELLQAFESGEEDTPDEP